ncbi:MAG TPA: DUF6445 family protein [Pirellulales bacterium]
MSGLIKYIDGFYSEPDLIREIALRSEYYVPKGLYGFRSTKGFLARDTIEKIKSTFGFDEINLLNVSTRSTHFYHSLAGGSEKVRFFAHYDAKYNPERPSYAFLVYLKPNAPKDTGTGVYRHKATGIWKEPTREDAARLGVPLKKLITDVDDDCQDRSRWELLDRIDNVYNRAVLFPAHWFHSSSREFGTKVENGKLYHAFFFNARPDPFTV